MLSDNFFAYEFNSVSMLKMKIRKLKLIKVNTYLMSDMTGFTSDKGSSIRYVSAFFVIFEPPLPTFNRASLQNCHFSS